MYFFFVLFFLPTFYKKFRMRTLIKTVNSLNGVLALRNVLVSLTFFVDYFKGLSAGSSNFIRLGLFFFISESYLGATVGAVTLNRGDLTHILSVLTSTGFVIEFFNEDSSFCVRVQKN